MPLKTLASRPSQNCLKARVYNLRYLQSLETFFFFWKKKWMKKVYKILSSGSFKNRKNACPTHKSTPIQLFWKHGSGFDKTHRQHEHFPSLHCILQMLFSIVWNCGCRSTGLLFFSSVSEHLYTVRSTCWKRTGTRRGKGRAEEECLHLHSKNCDSFCCTLNLKNLFNPCWARFLSTTVFRAFI